MHVGEKRLLTQEDVDVISMFIWYRLQALLMPTQRYINDALEYPH
jgi:hypothetical protein